MTTSCHLNSSWALSKQEPYYSNKDITILHSIVSTAQEQFNSSPHPKPLPAAVLFKAYDDVLPMFGIDPDSDHHLSALVFRIGGESGNGSLLEKFHALLKRMGILLEFDDDVTTSDLSCSTSSTSHHEAAETPPLQTLGSDPADEEKEDGGPHLKASGVSPLNSGSAHKSHGHFISKSSHDLKRLQPASHRTQDLGEQCKGISSEAVSGWSERGRSNTLNSSGEPAIEINDANRATLQKQVLISAIDRWRNIASGEKNSRMTPDHNPLTLNGDQKSRNSINVASIAGDPCKLEGNSLPFPTQLETGARDLGAAENDVLLLRAVRARQIFLASRIFSRWADETAIRLEREAIARRHMVRFRCFNSWIGAPTAKLPRAKRLKALSAVQKLQRAVACQEEQLELTASLIAASRISKIASQILNFWFTGVSSQMFAKTRNRLVRTGAINRWLAQTRDYNQTGSSILCISRHSRNKSTLVTWINHKTKYRTQAKSSQEFATGFDRLHWLRIWRDHAELGRRVNSCQQLLTMEQSAREFEIWHLRARADTFRWKREYTSATKFIDAWLAVSSRFSALQASSGGCFRSYSAMKFASHLGHFYQTQLQLDVLGYRAQWYIRATSLLGHFGAMVRHRKQQMKLVVRRYLMMRYTQVSSRKRRRGFYTALSRWQSHAITMQAMTTAMEEYQASSNVHRKQAICAVWGKFAVEQAVSHTLAIHHRRGRFLNEWSEHASANHQQELDAAVSWATEQQRQSLKAWTISTLQKSGQAHSADMVKHRHERDLRNRAFQRWRSAASRSKPVDFFPELQSQSPALTGLVNSSYNTTRKHSKWRPLFPRLDYNQEALTPVHTPSRSTGLLFPSTHAPPIRFMDPVGRTDGKLENSDARGSDMRGHDLVARAIMPRQVDLPTTTPKVPVPAHVQISSRYVPALTGHERQRSPIKLTRMRSIRGHISQVSDPVAAASQLRNHHKEGKELPGRALDGEPALQNLSLSRSNVRPTFARTVPVRMGYRESGSGTGVATPSLATGNAPPGKDGAEFP
ncbi:hypothetical protein C2857_001538 [Epichloe festucae Fl1]|uniref:Sfi1 spindle body domain-containing protein n=1 Tax=Epichloe festucae (strain Fl1) TaxID=877507 RepID=A0A7S9KUG4_EPIFF|nr:hypothetical protein C2857_001538 [Epichloe festucae Fl1]